eukprot:scaffold1880_cov207-Alexandrium_tamarense.AAC.5
MDAIHWKLGMTVHAPVNAQLAVLMAMHVFLAPKAKLPPFQQGGQWRHLVLQPSDRPVDTPRQSDRITPRPSSFVFIISQ